MSEPSIHPFPGLRPFEANEHDLFFGREGQSEDILGRLREHRFVAVVGASGSGKSSLIRAGLLPYLHGGFLAGAGSHWRVAIFRPGGDPIRNLALALDDPGVLGHAADNADAAAQSSMLLEVTLRRSGLGLIEAVRLARLPEREQVLIVVDQFEELFRFAGAADRPGGEEDAAAFVKLLLEAGRQRDLPIYVVLTMRSDYIGDCARYRGLPEAVTEGLYLIPRMTRDQRRAAIVEPVRVGGGMIAPRLVVRLLNDVGDDPDQLPILQHALMRTWDYWLAHGGQARPIDVGDYAAIGGMADALSQHADEAYDGLADDRDRAIAKRMFQALSEKGLDNRETRRPTAAGTLAHVVAAPLVDVIRIVDDFRAPGRSFLMPGPSVALDPAAVIDISHESLIRGWRRMRQWVEDESESARQYRRLAETAALHAQGTAGLLRDPDLGNALIWRDNEHPNADWAHRYHPGFQQAMAFLEQSRLARDAELRQKETARRRLRLAGSAATAAITLVAIIALWQWHEAQAESARERQALAITEELTDSLVFDLAQNRSMADVAPEKANGSGAQTNASAEHAPKTGGTQDKVTTARAANLSGRLSHMLTEILDHAIKVDDAVIAIAPTAAAYTNRASAHRRMGNLDQAIADCDKAIQLDRAYFRAYNVRGNIYAGRSDYSHAIADFDEAIKLSPKFGPAYVGRGLAFQDKGDIQSAIADFNQAIGIDSSDYRAYFDRGAAYLATKDYDHALADVTKAISYGPNLGFLYNTRGRIYGYKGDLDSAIADFTQAIALTADAKDPAPYNNRGLAYYRKKDYASALADYDEAVRLDPRYAVAYDNRGDVDSAKGDLGSAIADYSKAIAIDPKTLDYYNDRGNAYFDRSDYQHAIADYDRAIAIDPKLALLYKNRARAYQLTGDLARAMADYDKAIALDPKYALAYAQRGEAYFDKHDYQRAIADYDRAIAIDPKKALFYKDRGRAYKFNDDLGDAITDFNRAIALDPKYALAYEHRGYAYEAMGDFKKAIADFASATALSPDEADFYDDSGVAYYLSGDYKQAIAYYGRAIKIDPKYETAFFTRGLADVYAGSPADALADLQKAAALDPKDAYAAIWLDIVGNRANVPSRLAETASRIDMTKWPAPVIGLYLGKLTAEQVRAAVANAAATDKQGQTCEANFYSGELALAGGGKDAALRLFQLAAADCPKDYYERQAADAELALLGEATTAGATRQDPAPAR